MKMKHDLAHIDRRFDIDEPTSETSSQSNAQQVPLEYGKRVDAHRLAAVRENGGWWNPTTQELIPILPEDDPNYGQNQEMSASLIGQLGSSAFRLTTTAVSMSLAGSRFSSDSAPRPFHHGIRGQVEQSLPRPCRNCRRVQADIRTHLIRRPARDVIPPLGGAPSFLLSH